MRLNVTDVRPEDFGEYECVSKNDINTTAATFHVYGDLNAKKNELFQLNDMTKIKLRQKEETRKIEIYECHFIRNCRWCTSSDANIFRDCRIWNAATQTNIIQ